MASPNVTFTELVSTTFKKYNKKFADNLSRNNALYRQLAEGKRVKEESGGTTLVEQLDYAANQTYQRYSGYDVLNVSASDVLSAAEFQWRQIAVNVVASGLETRINMGDSQIIDLVKARITNALRTFKNNFSYDLYSDGSAPNQINGLQALVSDAGTGTVGGIDALAWPFWRNVVQSAGAPLQGGGAIVPGPTTIESLMAPLYYALTRGDDQPDMIVASNDYFAFFEASQVSLKRYTSDSGPQSGKAGFVSLLYKRAKVFFDGGSGIPAQRMYFLNTDYMRLRVHEKANLTTLDEAKPYNQDASVVPILWMGNMTVNNRALQGVLKP